MKRMRPVCQFLLLGTFISLILFSHPLPGRGTGKIQVGNHLECPKDIKVLRKKYEEAYKKLLAVMGTGEGGKMDTPQKQKAYEVYQFYKNCYATRSGISANTETASQSLLLTCFSRVLHQILSIDMSVKETASYNSLKRVEISIRTPEGKEFFRAMVNRSSSCAPIPPNAFGVFPVGEKENPSLKDIKSAGHEARIPLQTQYGSLAPGCKTFWNEGTLDIHWQIHVAKWPTGNQGFIYVKIIPKHGKPTSWIRCGNVPLIK